MSQMENRVDKNRGHSVRTCDVILGVDVGSSSVRCTAYHYSRKNNSSIDTIPVGGCSSSIQRRSVEPITGMIQTDGFLDAVDSTVEEVLSKLRAKFECDERKFVVQAVGFSTFVMNLIAVNEQGKLIPLDKNDDMERKFLSKNDAATKPTDSKRYRNTNTVSISYACNAAEVHAECQRIREELGPNELDALYEVTGAPLHSAYALPQLRVLYKEGRSSLGKQKKHHWQSIAGYCLSQWTGRKCLPITYSEASWTGLLNIRDCVFEESAIRCLPPNCRAALPELADFTDCILGIPEFLDGNNNLTNPYWEKYPELRATKFFLGIGDGACANVGSKCTGSSRISVTVGTSAAVRMCLRHQALSSPIDLPFRIPDCRGLFCYRIDRNHILVGGALTDGGSIVEWATRFLNIEKDESAFQKCLDETQRLVEAEFEKESTTQRSDLIMAPFLSGERSTGFRDGAVGAVFGLTRETTPAHFLKSCLEGVSLRLRAIIQLLLVVVDRKRKEDRENFEEENTSDTNNSDARLPVIVASGKALEVNHTWRQMIADSSGLCIVLDKETVEGTSRGVARLVATSLLLEEEEPSHSKVKLNRNTFSENCTEETPSKASLPFEVDEEVLHQYLISEPRSIATTVYARKSCLQEDFIDSITPFFSSS